MSRIRNEFFNGANMVENDRIAAFLRQKRSLLPAAFSKYITLSNMLAEEDSPDIDPLLFLSIMEKARTYFSDLSDHFKFLSYDCYMVKKHRSDDIGGFHGKIEKGAVLNAGGYRYIDDVGFGRTLNLDIVRDIKLRTYELARNYLHDAMHASSFRTFKISQSGEIYRSQYGINYRDEDGHGYSSPETTPDGQVVNLNILMEGLIQKLIGEFIVKVFPDDHIRYGDRNNIDLSPEERDVWADITLTGGYKFEHVPQMDTFYEDVMVPTDRFLERWDSEGDRNDYQGTPLKFKIFHAMMSGDLSDVHMFMDEKFYGKNQSGQAWSDVFRQSKFSGETNLTAAAVENTELPEFIYVGPFGYILNPDFPPGETLDAEL